MFGPKGAAPMRRDPGACSLKLCSSVQCLRWCILGHCVHVCPQVQCPLLTNTRSIKTSSGNDFSCSYPASNVRQCQTVPNSAKQCQTVTNSAKPCQTVPNSRRSQQLFCIVHSAKCHLPEEIVFISNQLFPRWTWKPPEPRYAKTQLQG